MNIFCANCGNDEFTPDLEDNAIFKCKKCEAEITIQQTGNGFLTLHQKRILLEKR